MKAGLILVSFLYITFSILTYKNYGITSDEYVEYESGRDLLYYYQNGEEPNNPRISDRHSPTSSTYFRGHLALFSLLNPDGEYERFHLFNMLFALPIFLMFYSLLFSRYRNNLIAVGGTLVLFFTARFTGDIPANPKDVPFAVFFFLSLGSIYFVEKLRTKFLIEVLTLGVLFGITSAFRLIGVSLFLIYALYLLLILKNFKLKDFVLTVTVAALILVWSLPLFSHGVVDGFRILIESASSFDYWDNKILFMGEFITKEERPVSYLPIWLLITIPLAVLIPFLASPVVVFLKKVKDEGMYLLMFLALGVNLALYLVVNPVIYNGLRHFLFLVPIIVFVSFITLMDLYPLAFKLDRKFKYSIFAVIALLFLLNIKSFVSLHPYQYTYFNELASGLKGAAGKFDSDYWGTTYKESSLWIKDNFGGKGVKVFACDMGFAVEHYANKEFQLVFEFEEADFIVCDLDNNLQTEFDEPVVYSVERESVPLNVVRDNR